MLRSSKVRCCGTKNKRNTLSLSLSLCDRTQTPTAPADTRTGDWTQTDRQTHRHKDEKLAQQTRWTDGSVCGIRVERPQTPRKRDRQRKHYARVTTAQPTQPNKCGALQQTDLRLLLLLLLLLPLLPLRLLLRLLLLLRLRLRLRLRLLLSSLFSASGVVFEFLAFLRLSSVAVSCGLSSFFPFLGCQ